MALIDGLISYYKLDENAANTTVADSHGSNTGTATTNTSNLYDASGVINSQFHLVRANTEYIDCGNDSSFAVNDFSFHAWIDFDSFTNGNTIVSYGQGNWTYTVVYFTSTDKIHFYATLSGGGVDLLSSDTLSNLGWSTGEKHAIGVSHEAGVGMKLYLDGSLDNSVGTSGTLTTTSNSFQIGRQSANAGRKWDGKIDEAALFGTVKNATEMSDLYNSGAGLAYPFSAATLRLIKIGGSFVEKPILTKISGTFVDKPIKIKTGGIFQDA